MRPCDAATPGQIFGRPVARGTNAGRLRPHPRSPFFSLLLAREAGKGVLGFIQTKMACRMLSRRLRQSALRSQASLAPAVASAGSAATSLRPRHYATPADSELPSQFFSDSYVVSVASAEPDKHLQLPEKPRVKRLHLTMPSQPAPTPTTLRRCTDFGDRFVRSSL